MSTDNTRQLRETILDEGIQNAYFFNGRVLTASDLSDEQQASRQQRQQLGRAIGTGVVAGLEVRLLSDGAGGGSPLVEVAAGLALNACGQPVQLARSVQLALARQQDVPSTDAGLFSDCAPPQLGPNTTGKGAYLLLAAPASGYRGQAPRVGVGDNGKAAGCGSRYAVEGLSFRLEELNIATLPGIHATTRSTIATLMSQSEQTSLPAAIRQARLSKLRNLLAHLCLGTEDQPNFAADPFRRDAQGHTPLLRYGALDALRSLGRLVDCDVPLALIYWTAAGVRFVDMWAVRRRMTRPCPDQQWSAFSSDRRQAEHEAALLQFAAQVEALRAAGNLGAALAAHYFAYLPSAGLLPVSGIGSPTGFNPQTFFGNRASGQVVLIDGPRLRALLHEAQTHEPISLISNEPIQLYRIVENEQAVAQQQASQLVLAFACATLGFRGPARFGFGTWDQSGFPGDVS